jgi:nucleoside-diphosphate-sugar epimerase
VYVEDVVDLLQVAAAHPKAAGQVLHAATGRTHAIREVVETILTISGAAVAPEFGSVARQQHEPQHWSASIRATTELTGWQPRFDLRAGLERTWAWARSNE